MYTFVRLFYSIIFLHVLCVTYCGDNEPTRKQLSPQEKAKFKITDGIRLSMWRKPQVPAEVSATSQAEISKNSEEKSSKLELQLQKNVETLTQLEHKLHEILDVGKYLAPNDKKTCEEISQLQVRLNGFFSFDIDGSSSLRPSAYIAIGSQLINLKDKIKLEQLVRENMRDSKTNMRWLLEHAHETSYSTAHLAVCNHLTSKNSSPQEKEKYSCIYFELLSPTDQLKYLNPFLQYALTPDAVHSKTFENLIASVGRPYQDFEESTRTEDAPYFKKDELLIQSGALAIKKLCSLNANELSPKQYQCADEAIEKIYLTIGSRQAPARNEELLVLATKAKFERVAYNLLSKGEIIEGYTYIVTNKFQLFEKNHEHLSGAMCYYIASGLSERLAVHKQFEKNNDIIKEKEQAIYTWLKRATERGYEKVIHHFISLAMRQKKDNAEIVDTLGKACEANPKSKYNAVMRDLFYIKILSDNIENLKDSHKQFFSKLVSAYTPDLDNTKNQELYFYIAYSYIYATIMNHIIRDEPINQANVNSLLKSIYTMNFTTDTRFNPIVTIPTQVVTYFESIIEKNDAITTHTITQPLQCEETVAVATYVLLSCYQFHLYENKTLIEKGLRSTFSYSETDKADFSPWFERETDTHDLKRELLLVACHQTNLEPFFKASIYLETMPLRAKSTDESVVEHKLCQAFIFAPLAQRLKKISESSPYAHRIERLLFRSSYYTPIEQTNILQKLCKHNNTDTEAQKLYRQQIESDVRNATHQMKITQRVDLYNKLKCASHCPAEDLTTTKELCISDPTSAHFTLLADCYALKDMGGKEMDLITTSLEQARRLSKISHNSWLKYVTPCLQQTIWLYATEDIPGDTQGKHNERGYACLLNATKSVGERLQLLQPGYCKNPLCSLLYAQCLLEKNGAKTALELDRWSVRDEIYTLLRYAIMQGQQSRKTAAEPLDGASACEATSILKEWADAGDLGAGIVLASVEPDIKQGAEIIGAVKVNFDPQTNECIADKHSSHILKLENNYSIAKNLSNLSQTNHGAQKALARLYLTTALSYLNNETILNDKDKHATEWNVSMMVLGYGSLHLIQTYKDLQQQFLKLTNKALEHDPKNKSLIGARKVLTKVVFI